MQALARKPHQEVVMVVLLLSNMGLFLVDHIHFQVSSSTTKHWRVCPH